MSFSDLKNRFFPGKTENRADPAHAFGSEEQVMAAFQQQTYVKPQPGRASVLTGLRERLSRTEAPRRKSDAPVYSADTYSRPSAPDLGWEAAFNPAPADEAPPAGPDAPLPSAEDRFEAFRRTVYSSPAQSVNRQPAYGRTPPAPYSRPAPVYEVIGGPDSAPRTRELAKPEYEEISFRPPARRENTYAKPVYEEIDLRGGREKSPTPDPPADEDSSLFDSLGSEGGVLTFPDPADNSPSDSYPEQEPVYQSAPKAGDMQYFFWSGSIVLGTILTLFAFVYACAM